MFSVSECMLIYPTKMWLDENLSLVEKEEISATNKIKVKKKIIRLKLEQLNINFLGSKSSRNV